MTLGKRPPERATTGAVALGAVSLLAATGCGNSSQGHYTRDQLLDPQTCKECHPTYFADWSSSMHAYASDDPLFVAMNRRAQEQGHVGDFCVRCHAPVAFRTGKTTDGLNLAALPQSVKGVTCTFCHNVDGLVDVHDSGSLNDDALHFADDGVMRASIPDPVSNKAHLAAYSPLHDGTLLQSAQLCGGCHDVVNGHGAHIERTYAEWSATLYDNTVGGNPCGPCHMHKSTGIAANAPGVVERTVHDHKFPGVDLPLAAVPQADPSQVDVERQAVQDFLDTELSVALCVDRLGPATHIFIVVDNIAAGHNWPSGAAQDRRAWFQVVASLGGSPIYQSGVVAAGTDPADSSDPDLWLLRDCMLGGQGQPVTAFWDAVGPSDSNTLPGAVTIDQTSPAFYNTHVKQKYPRSPSATLSAYPDLVTLDVNMLAFPPDLFDDLFSNPASLGLAAGDVQAMRAKLVPLAVGRTLQWTPAAAMDPNQGGITTYDRVTGEALSCVTTGVNPRSQTVPPPQHMSPACKP